ncbi:hypothetical protein E8E13_011247 [Curvularia kusanoi]|uniref:Uncharacterized protein n=1 Tax=Curvularia kusanoi TaxID=90978 RepID=A0A9P4WDG2_CURKU|nr:hypothetical protein E8E13_011247 [Curvularia kusanoi]
MAPKLRSGKGEGDAEAGKDTSKITPKITKAGGSKVNFTPRPNRLPVPNDEALKPVDPLDQKVWEDVKPANDDEMQTWMNDMKALILANLRYWRARAEDVTVQQSKVRLERAMNSEWAKWEPLTDIQTGEIYDLEKREQMYKAMTAEYKASKGDYVGRTATADAGEYADYASAVWEDFLHYQNEWARVPFRVTKEHSKATPDPPSATETPEPSIATGTPNPPIATETPNPPIATETPNPPIATEKDEGFSVQQGDGRLKPWQSNLIGLYEKHRIGDRTKIPENGVGPDQLHCIPDNIRHSANGQERRNHLIEKFPTSSIRLDIDAIARRREEVDKERNAKQDAEATSIDSRKCAAVERLPEGHQPYYATNELFETKRDMKGKPTETDVEKIIWEKIFALDEDENRIPDSATFWNYETPTYEPKGTVTEQHEYVTNPRTRSRHVPRREAYRRLQKSSLEDNDDEMSVAGDDEYQEDEVPFLSSSEEEDELEDDEETDLFLLSYRNLAGSGGGNTNGNDGGLNDDDGGSNDDEGGSNHGHGGSSQDGGDSDDKGGDIGKLKGPMAEKGCRIGTGVEQGQRIFEYSFRYNATTTYTQRIVLDPVNNEAKDEKDDKGKIPRVIYPEKDLREIFNDRSVPEGAWSSVPEKGHWELTKKGKQWVPILVLIRAKKATGKVDYVFDLTKHLTELLRTNFSKASVATWNKTVRQKDDRADQKPSKKLRWVREEIEELVRILNDMALKEGIQNLVGRWTQIHREVTAAFEIFWNRLGSRLGLPKRGDEAVRPKLSRSPGINKKLEDVRAAKQNGSPETHPSNFFTVSDFSPAKPMKTGKSVEGDETDTEPIHAPKTYKEFDNMRQELIPSVIEEMSRVSSENSKDQDTTEYRPVIVPSMLAQFRGLWDKNGVEDEINWEHSETANEFNDFFDSIVREQTESTQPAWVTAGRQNLLDRPTMEGFRSSRWVTDFVSPHLQANDPKDVWRIVGHRGRQVNFPMRRRKADADAGNALLNMAIMRPAGSLGDLKSLGKDTREDDLSNMSEDEMKNFQDHIRLVHQGNDLQRSLYEKAGWPVKGNEDDEKMGEDEDGDILLKD